MPDLYSAHAASLSTPLIGGFPIIPNDNSDLPQTTRQIRVTGSGGAVAVVWADGSQSTEPVSAGETLDWRIARVRATGTTASGLRGYY